MIKISKIIKFFASEILDMHSIFMSLDLEEKAEFAKIISFGMFVNGIYGVLHGNLWDLPVVFVSSYAIIKTIKIIKKEKKC